jgi:ribonuclease-3
MVVNVCNLIKMQNPFDQLEAPLEGEEFAFSTTATTTTTTQQVNRKNLSISIRQVRFQQFLLQEIGYSTSNMENIDYLLQAFDHPSINAKERQKQNMFQRLEWLGDSVLRLCMSDILWKQSDYETEAQLSRKRTVLLRTSSLAQYAKKLDLMPLISSQSTAGILADGILADTVEVLLGLMFLRIGYIYCKLLCEKIAELTFAESMSVPVLNPKATLQEWALAALEATPTYQVVSQTGPQHMPQFRVRVILGNQTAEGTGTTKQQAEEQAALKLFDKQVTHTNSRRPSLSSSITNPKGMLQERLAQLKLGLPTYELLREIGPPDAPFKIRAGAKDWYYETAYGATRKEAETEAAILLLSHLPDSPADTMFKVNNQEEVDETFTRALHELQIEQEKGTRTNSRNLVSQSTINSQKSQREESPPSKSDRQNRLEGRITFASPTPTSSAVPVKTQIQATLVNPKGHLQELLVREKISPRYELLSREGPSHAPFFTVALFIGPGRDPFTVGLGRTNKSAEENAATQALMLLEAKGVADSSKRASPTDEFYVNLSNPKGTLQEYCVKTLSVYPEYVESIAGPPKFVYQVIVNQELAGTGEGTSKQQAQSEAALAALKKLGYNHQTS